MIESIIIPLLSLIALEVVLGIDNVIFISILAEKLPVEQRAKLRYLGIGLAVVLRLILLGSISWILTLDTALFQIGNYSFTGKAIILLIGGLFLLYKSTKEIYHKTEHQKKEPGESKSTFQQLLMEVLLLDVVFSIDSIITAVGMVSDIWIMYTAVLVSVSLMLLFSGKIHAFISSHPSFKVLALCFLMMIGVTLIAEGFSFHFPKGYIYFSMAFAFLVDVIQLKTVKKN